MLVRQRLSIANEKQHGLVVRVERALDAGLYTAANSRKKTRHHRGQKDSRRQTRRVDHTFCEVSGGCHTARICEPW